MIKIPNPLEVFQDDGAIEKINFLWMEVNTVHRAETHFISCALPCYVFNIIWQSTRKSIWFLISHKHRSRDAIGKISRALTTAEIKWKYQRSFNQLASMFKPCRCPICNNKNSRVWELNLSSKIFAVTFPYSIFSRRRFSEEKVPYYYSCFCIISDIWNRRYCWLKPMILVL